MTLFEKAVCDLNSIEQKRVKNVRQSLSNYNIHNKIAEIHQSKVPERATNGKHNDIICPEKLLVLSTPTKTMSFM
jgi:hypothetical protein